ncbi:uncharacterized protein Eint_090570 [Encephalitozoon intestinalis ATCC 50506]|uniref:Uncharacterized protein n=1 Tax=Encephalitozoon intestinalis (strain ATCC 50506) TaxID=876142 RepID=E0S9C2_ENCIT|nr:uncharacterized protein Eint_090570 [Encephalitozoon intestinalis ATCC 50506]ADM12186.1 hypothetical protein Eint_090570 [Encephalitozoon intestinalis ATCC 50506]UTX45993.1 hypothetical protein GPK93_09g15790 [Encephalitozoon intestinalis]
MAGFYERIKEAWNSVKDALQPGKKVDLNSYKELCSRFESEKPIEVSELDRIKELCKAISEPGCRKKLDEGFEELKRVEIERSERKAGAKWKGDLGAGDTKGGEGKPKKHRKRGYQKKYALKKENDVSWGVLPKKYRVEGKTPMETIEKAICYDAEDNLFLQLGEVSTDEEEEYFCERNIKKLNSEVVERKVRCNFGGEYNCKRCVEYEIRKEYERKENERRKEERERAEKRRQMAKDRWESRVPKSYFYLEKDFGVERAVARYVTDDKFDMDDLEDEERKKLTRVLSEARKEQLFDIEKIKSRKASFDESRNEVTEIGGIKDDGEKNDKEAEPEQVLNGSGQEDRKEVGIKTSNESESLPSKPYFILEPISETKENGSDDREAVEMSEDAKKVEDAVQMQEPFVFGGEINESLENEKKEGPAVEEEPKKFGFWDGRTPNVQGDTSMFLFNSGAPLPPAQDSPSTVNHENISSPFASDGKAPETKPFVFGGGSFPAQSGMGQESVELHSPTPGSSLLKRKLGGYGEAVQDSGANFSFGEGGNIFLSGSSGIPGLQSFPVPGSTGQEQARPQQQIDLTGSMGNIFGNGKSLFGGLFEGGSSQQPAKPSIGYVDSEERNDKGLGGLFGGGGIFNAADDDPFERSKLDRRR